MSGGQAQQASPKAGHGGFIFARMTNVPP